MKTHTLLKAIAALATLALLAPLAGAHGHATVVEVNGTRCYVVTDGFALFEVVEEGDADHAAPQFWIESNGDTSGGESRGPPGDGTLPVYGVPFWDLGEFALHFIPPPLPREPGDVDESLEDGESGLQRGEGGDEEVDAAEWTTRCFTPAL